MDVDPSPIEAAEHGRAARWAGAPEGANPYPAGTPEHGAWRTAWEAVDCGEPEDSNRALFDAAGRPIVVCADRIGQEARP